MRKGSSLPEKSPRKAGRGGQYRRASSTALSTAAGRPGKRLNRVAPTSVHTCGGISPIRKAPAKRGILSSSNSLLCWPPGRKREDLGVGGAPSRAVCRAPLGGELRAAQGGAQRRYVRQMVR